MKTVNSNFLDRTSQNNSSDIFDLVVFCSRESVLCTSCCCWVNPNPNNDAGHRRLMGGCGCAQHRCLSRDKPTPAAGHKTLFFTGDRLSKILNLKYHCTDCNRMCDICPCFVSLKSES